jgi:arsenate reductase-like glutaredoxin family protein
VDANKVRLGRGEAVALARSRAKKVVTGRGKNLVTIDLAKDAPDDDTLAGLLLGPTGNLKAPTLLVGKTLLVGFNEAAYGHYLN